MGRYKKIPLQRVIDNYFGRLFSLTVFLTKKIKGKGFLKNLKKVTVFRLSSIGDSILLLPAISNLKDKTGAEIIVVCSKENFPIFQGQSFINKIIVLDNKSLNPFKILKILMKIKKENSNLSIDATHSSNLSSFFSYFGGRVHIGFSNPKTSMRNKVYDKTIQLNTKKHMVFNYLDLFSLAGVKYDKNRIKLIKPAYSDKEKLSIEKKLQNKRGLAGIYATTKPLYKKWPSRNIIKLIKFISSKKYDIVFVGSSSEKKLYEDLLKKIDEKTLKGITNLSGNTSTKELIALMSKLSFFVANDGGPMHIAASMDVPTLGFFSKAPEDPILGLFGSEDRFRYYPFNKKSNILYKEDIKNLEFSEVKKALEKML